MARLLVEACTAEWMSGDVVYTLLTGVSVSRVDSGQPVTGLTKANFRVASSIGLVDDFQVGAAYEWTWEPSDVEPSGCYAVEISMAPSQKFVKGSRYVFGIQVRTFSAKGPTQVVVDQGQTIVELVSMGE
jgi:hypothetical protein